MANDFSSSISPISGYGNECFHGHRPTTVRDEKFKVSPSSKTAPSPSSHSRLAEPSPSYIPPRVPPGHLRHLASPILKLRHLLTKENMSITDHVPHHVLDSQNASLSSCLALVCGSGRTPDLGTAPRGHRAVHDAIPTRARTGDARVSAELVCRRREIGGGEEGPAAAAGLGRAEGVVGDLVDGVGGAEGHVAFRRCVARIRTGSVAVCLACAMCSSRAAVDA